MLAEAPIQVIAVVVEAAAEGISMLSHGRINSRNRNRNRKQSQLRLAEVTMGRLLAEQEAAEAEATAVDDGCRHLERSGGA
jgi:hypothetical protein